MKFLNRPKCSPRCVLLSVCLSGAMLVLTSYVSSGVHYTRMKEEKGIVTNNFGIGNMSSGQMPGRLIKAGSKGLFNKAVGYKEGAVNANSKAITADIEKLSTKEKANGVRFTLIVTCARSGSSWLSDMTSQAPGTFYVFEPLWGYVKEGYYYKGDTICFNNNKCRAARTTTERNRFALERLYYFFTCDLHKVYASSRSPKLVRIASREANTAYRACMQRHGRNCTNVYSSACFNSTNRILKVIRLSMELVRAMMELFPQLHVVHLVRDPRAVTASRLSNTRTFTMARDTDSQTIDMCKRVCNDISVFRELRDRFPNRLTSILYEDLTEDTQKHAERLFDFLHLKMTEGVVSWIYNSTHATRSENAYFGTNRADPAAMANKWRRQLDFEDVEYIDKTCADVYQQVGYLPIKTEKELKNLTVPSRSAIGYQ